MEYALLHVRATPEDVDDALRTIAADWSGQVIEPKTHLGESWSTVLVTERTASSLAPVIGELLHARVLVVTVAGERLGMSHWRPGSPEVRVDGRDDVGAEALASAFGTNTGRLRSIVQDTNPAAERHAQAAKLLMLPLPVLTGHQPVYDGRPIAQPSELPNLISRFRRRQRLRRIYPVLGLLEIVAFLAVDYFWFLEPSAWLMPVLAFFVVNGVVLLLLKRWLSSRPRVPSTA